MNANVDEGFEKIHNFWFALYFFVRVIRVVLFPPYVSGKNNNFVQFFRGKMTLCTKYLVMDHFLPEHHLWNIIFYRNCNPWNIIFIRICNPWNIIFYRICYPCIIFHRTCNPWNIILYRICNPWISFYTVSVIPGTSFFFFDRWQTNH